MTQEEFEWKIQNSLKEGKVINQANLDLDKAKELLEEALYFINQVPNNKYSTLTYKNSYELAGTIHDYLKQLDKD